MFTVKEIQLKIFNETGAQTSVKKMTGSMKRHLCFTSIKSKGIRKEFNFDWRQNFVKQFSCNSIDGNYHSEIQIEILLSNFSDIEAINYRQKEKRAPIQPEPIESKGAAILGHNCGNNRQHRRQVKLDKAARIYSKKLRAGYNIPRYL